MIVSLLMEPFSEEIDDLENCLANPSLPRLIPSMQLAELKQILNTHYSWVDDIDDNTKNADHYFWYVSEEKLEPRLGERYQEAGAELEMPFNIPRYIKELNEALATYDDKQTVGEFLLNAPKHRHIIRRVQTIAQFPYGEIRDNLVGSKCRPIDLLRCKLSFFGAGKFDPKSNRWTRITLYQGAPIAIDLKTDDIDNLDDWLFGVGSDMRVFNYETAILRRNKFL